MFSWAATGVLPPRQKDTSQVGGPFVTQPKKNEAPVRVPPFVLFQDLLLTGPVGQQVYDVFDGQPCTPDHRLAGHHPGILVNPLQQLFILQGLSHPVQNVHPTRSSVRAAPLASTTVGWRDTCFKSRSHSSCLSKTR
jgi:hypothetical protein